MDILHRNQDHYQDRIDPTPGDINTPSTTPRIPTDLNEDTSKNEDTPGFEIIVEDDHNENENKSRMQHNQSTPLNPHAKPFRYGTSMSTIPESTAAATISNARVPLTPISSNSLAIYIA